MKQRRQKNRTEGRNRKKAVSVIICLGCVIIKNARQCADLEWQLNFAEVQLQHLDCVQNVNPDFPVSEGQEDGESGILTGEE